MNDITNVLASVIQTAFIAGEMETRPAKGTFEPGQGSGHEEVSLIEPLHSFPQTDGKKGTTVTELSRIA